MRELQRAATERHVEEERLAEEKRLATKKANRRRDSHLREVEESSGIERDRISTDFEGRRSMGVVAYEAERARTQDEYHQRRTKAEAQAAKTAEQAARKKKELAWQILTLYDTAKEKTHLKLKSTQQRLATLQAGIATIGAEAVAIAQNRGIEGASILPVGSPLASEEKEEPANDDACHAAEACLQEAVVSARDAAQALYDQRLPQWIAGPLPLGAFAGMLSVVLPAAALALSWADWRAYAIGLGAAMLASIASYFALLPKARRQTATGFEVATEAIRTAEKTFRQASQRAVDRAQWEESESRTQRDTSLEELGVRLEQLVGKAMADRDAEFQEITQVFPTKLSEMRDGQKQALEEIEREYAERVTELTSRYDEKIARIEGEHADETTKINGDYETGWQRMFEKWLTQFDDIRAELRDMRSACQRLFPDFSDTDFSEWIQPTEPPTAIAFGTTEINLARIKNGLSEDKRLEPPQTRLEMPALMALNEHPTMLVTAPAEGRADGVNLLQAMMLRFLTAMPPGKVRFTILDPIGLGDNFQSFMHLADIDDQLIAGRIWSEPRDIDEQLGRLTNHMETVIQKYLRSEYETIHEYNAQAGEVAEPFQVIVAAGFPANFSETATRRLTSLMTGGPRCGVYTLLGVDTQAKIHGDFRLDDLKKDAIWLDWDPPAGQFVWRYPAYEKLPLELASTPPPEAMIDTIRKAGEAAKAATKVEVPFSVVMPSDEEGLWNESCGDELLVPVGRSGAKSFQNVRLGKGTSQHLLVAGKTGSGKSTFLHALVTSAALRFSPDEVEFYLVDFKKGVEFKSYATHRLPHARVIAIESEREFGLSVLERLDEELQTRGESFRDAGVQNLADFRSARPDKKMPRTLLIIDEFQELFVEDDRLAQEAALLMDRLVRQGRAFGIHVLLGTQTLAGAYSIARSTLGQMAIRVALECSESDAHLIFSDERNTAARFLSRPGEAIYNCQNGMVAANEPFQVVWLSDNERSAQLDRIDEHRHSLELPRPETIVFEGNTPADPLTNQPLTQLLASRAPQRDKGIAPPAWLGAAVAIKPPTHAELGHHPGANLLVVGPDESSALGILTTAAISLCVAEPAKLVVLDGARPGEAGHGAWKKVTDALGEEATTTDQAGLAKVFTEIADEVARREAETENQDHQPIYLVLHNAARFRELRRREDDFSFGSSGDEPLRPDQQLAEILKNGPAVGIHTIVWCDSFNSAMRLFDRQTLREFAQRVALQMSAADSSNLIDTPAASDLAVHRALYYNDETGQTEKFRPYGPPSAEWLERIAER